MREQIADIASGLFGRLSIKSVTMSDVAAAAGISKKTLYQYYQDKNELVKEIYLTRLSKARSGFENILPVTENAIDEVFRIWQILRPVMAGMRESILHDLQKFHPAVFDQYEIFKQGLLCEMVIQNIERGKREGLYRENVNTDIIARHQVATMDLSQQAFRSDSCRWTSTVIDEELLLQYLNGLATAEGLKTIEIYWSEYHHNKTQKESSLS